MVGLDDTLGNAVMIPEVDKNEMAVIANAMHPAGQARFFSNILGAQFGASMASVTMHL